MAPRFRHFLSKLSEETSGAIAIQMALALPVLIGMVALGAEMTTLYVYQKRMQLAADQAVLSAGATGLTSDQRLSAAKAMVAANGFADATLTPPRTPTTGPNVNTQGAIEVILSRSYPLQLARLFLSSPITIKARAVSIPGRQSTGCVLALSPNADGAITVDNKATVTNTNCEIVSNSKSTLSSLDMWNNTTISGPVYLAGKARLAASAVVSGRPFVEFGAPISDPYANVIFPDPSGLSCTTQTNASGNVLAPKTALNPGRFCNGLVTSAKQDLVMNPGIYFIEKQLSFSNNSTLTATSGVTIILQSGSSFGIGQGVTWQVNAPLTGATAGLAFTSNPQVTGNVAIDNGANLIIEGAIYLPKMSISFNNRAGTSGAKCTQLIAQKITIFSALSFQADCTASNVKKIGRTQPVLSE